MMSFKGDIIMVSKFILCGALALSLTACSFFNSSQQVIRINASERDARIYVNGSFVGQGLVQARVPRDENLSILVTKDGYYPASREVVNKLSGVGIVDAIGGCFFLLPFFGLLSSGAWSLDQTNFTIVLDPQNISR